VEATLHGEPVLGADEGGENDQGASKRLRVRDPGSLWSTSFMDGVKENGGGFQGAKREFHHGKPMLTSPCSQEMLGSMSFGSFLAGEFDGQVIGDP